ncbi:Ca2+/calmodulin-dependent protein kinase [Fasciola gigantica]|uniref:Ca2+/calmodulin-dependent protein kinase n=1 Tax=Fasciola gigantica TaxID=46835 RepID=A0A504YQE6_FASGI|nr:Ca2+/calmodulin-dependent protein kinase [Fasciola gigantica]
MLISQEESSVNFIQPVQQSIFDEDKLLVYRELYYNGFSSIIAARDLTSGAAVAVKKVEFSFFKPCPFSITKLKENYANKINEQAAKIRAITHTSVVKLMEYVIEPKRVTIMTEMCMFGDLFNWMLQQAQLRVRDICLVVQNIFQALRFLHSQGYVHGALSPTTVLFQSVSPQSVTIMPDLSVRAEVLKLARVEPPIMDHFAPECLKTNTLKQGEDNEKTIEDGFATDQCTPTKASDIWNVGIIAHIAFTGKAPFRGRNAFELLKNIEATNGESRNEMFHTLSSLIRNQVNRSLSVNPETRLTAEEGSEVYWFDDEETKNDNRNILMTIEYELLSTCRRYRNQGRQVFENVFRKFNVSGTSLPENASHER